MDININYLRETTGGLNIAEWVASLLVLICASSSPIAITAGGWVYFASISGILVSFAFLLMHMTRMVDGLQERVNWFLVRLGYDVIFSCSYFVSMCISAAGAANSPADGRYRATHSSNAAAAVFAALAIVSFVWDGFETLQKKRLENTSQSQADRLTGAGEGARYT